jgi:hypothetical protein
MPPPRKTQPLNSRHPFVTWANTLTLGVGVCMLLFIMLNNDGYVRIAQLLLTLGLIGIQLGVGIVSIIINPSQWKLAIESFALQSLNLALIYVLPFRGSC